ncbi:MAG: flavin reductase family protein [Candidatus Bipolaricaulota bacterium]|nr:MAG: flavin reductase family protein [Candidatus Bipolaricaulota bacterium]
MKKSLGRKTLVTPTPVWVVGTYDADGKANIMTAAWAGICCSKPPSVCVSLREATYTYQSIVDRGAFTVNLPTVEQAVAADYAGIATGREADKFAVAGLTAERAGEVDAPIVAELPLNVECKLIHTLKIGLHTLFVGEIVDVQADEEILGEKDRPLLDKLRPFVFATTEATYRAIGEPIGPAFELGKALIGPE